MKYVVGWLSYILLAVVLLAVVACGSARAMPINVILFVGDGMGPEHIEAGRYFANGDTQPLTLETLTFFGTMTHNNFSGGTTDSAASATAMATGRKVNNSVISVALPGDGSELFTALEFFQLQGKRTGLVTIDTSITDATPAAFGAHTPSRSNHADIANNYFNQTRPNVLFGAPGSAVTPTLASNAGYDVVQNATELSNLSTATTTFVSGQFNFGSGGAPTLAQMTTTALDILNNDPDGFFLLVEHEDTDSGAHANEIDRVVNAVVELDQAVQAALNWTTTNGVAANTLIIVTADHETGGLNTTGNNGAGNLPTVTWSTTGHTQTPVPVFAIGPAADASRVQGTIDNTDIFYILTAQPIPDPLTFQQGVDGYGGTVDTFLQEASPTANNATAAQLNIDSDDPSGSSQDVQALLRFDNIFGNGPDDIPLGAVIESATLTLDVTNPGDSISLHRMLVAWDDDDTWSSLGGGVQADDVEAAIAADVVSGSVGTGLLTLDVTASLLAWQADPSQNFGWVILPSGVNGVDFFSSEGANPPLLSVTFTPEPPASLLLLIGLLAIVIGGGARLVGKRTGRRDTP